MCLFKFLQAEIAQLERQMRGKTRKRRTQAEEVAEPGLWERHRMKMILVLLLVIAVLALIYIFKKTNELRS